jgi:uncharacterized protein
VQPGIELTKMQTEAIKAAFRPFADSIEVVGVYGSRAQGMARPGSDVDLVVYGELTDRDFELIRGELDAGDLSIFADLVRYEDVKHAALKTQIDNWMKPLFHRNELLN